MTKKDVTDDPRWLNDTGNVETADEYIFARFRAAGIVPRDPKEREAYEKWNKENPLSTKSVVQ